MSMTIQEVVNVGKKGRAIEVDDLVGVRLTNNVTAPGKTLFLSPVMFAAAIREMDKQQIPFTESATPPTLYVNGRAE